MREFMLKYFFEEENKFIVYSSTLIISILISILIIFSLVKGVDFLVKLYLFVLFFVTSFIFIMSLIRWMKDKVLSDIENSFINFLRDLIDTLEAGMTFTNSIIFLSSRDYGYFSYFLKKAAKDLTFGEPFPKVMNYLKERLKKSDLISRSLDVIASVYYSGGDIIKTISSLQNSLVEIKNVEKDRAVIIKQQLLVIFIVHIIFIIILIMVYKSFIPLFYIFSVKQLAKTQVVGVTLPISFQVMITVEDLKLIVLLLFITISFSNGLISGVTLTKKIESGIQYFSFYLFFSLLAYLVFIYPPLFDISFDSTYKILHTNEIEKISGILILDGKPLSNTNYYCFLFNNLTSFGVSDELGRFSCNIYSQEEGVNIIRIVVDYRGMRFEKILKVKFI